MKIREEKGITIIALVITIIILIILATITINAVFGDNGLIKQAEYAKELSSNTTESEYGEMNRLFDDYANMMAEDNEISNDKFEPQPTPEPPTGGTEMSDMTNGVIEIKWLSGTSNNVSSSPNAPVMKTDLPSGTTMEQVVFDEESSLWVAGTEYSYIAGTGSSDNTASHWANARVTIDGIESYFVWIPRYAYRIIYFDSLESKKAYQEGTLTEEEALEQGKIIGYSDSRGIVDGQGRRIESVTSLSNTTHIMVSEDYFMVHPVFTTDIESGGWTEELKGIWVGKYEVSLVSKNNANNIIANHETIGNILLSNNPDKTMITKTGYISWKSCLIGNMYINSLSYSENLKSHMMKNSEWGAVAYLTESKYGRNGTEVEQNINLDYYTGGGSDNNYVTNIAQSTTGNVYGIYDLSGGAYEHISAYYIRGSNLNRGEPFTNKEESDAYTTIYSGDTPSASYIYGDATYETAGWHSDLNNFIDSIDSYFLRGGYCQNTNSYAGIFHFNKGNR